MHLRVFHCPSRVCPPNPGWNFYCYWTSNLLADSHTTIPPLLLNFPTPSLSTAIGLFLVFWNESFVLPCAFCYSQIIYRLLIPQLLLVSCGWVARRRSAEDNPVQGTICITIPGKKLTGVVTGKVGLPPFASVLYSTTECRYIVGSISCSLKDIHSWKPFDCDPRTQDEEERFAIDNGNC